MWSIFIPADGLAMDALSGELWELGTTGLLEEPGGLRAFFDGSVARVQICARFGLAETASRTELEYDLNSIQSLECDPVLIGERFFVAPSQFTEATPHGRFRLTIDATNAFGSGRHETTQMCIEALEKYLMAGSVVADIGCGSGILGAAALLLGAGTVISCDIQADSAVAAKQLLKTPVFVGSADGVQSNFADLVLANISAKVLDVVATDLKRIAKPAGLIIIAGFITENAPKRFQPGELLQKGDWQCWVCGPADILTEAEPQEPTAHVQQWWL